MRKSPDSFVSIFIAGVVGLGVLVWFVNQQLGSTAALVVVGGTFGAIMWMGGSVVTHATVKATMENLSEFNRADADIDKGRMAAFKAMAGGAAAQQRADAQIQVLNARRIDQIAQERARLITDNVRKQDEQSTSWDVFNDEDADVDSFVQWD
jgi:hypothetical protein